MKYLSLSSDEKNRPRTYANGYLIADKAAYATAEKVFRKPAELKPPKRIKTRTVILLTLWAALVVGLIVLGTVGKFDLPRIIAMLVMFFSLSVVTTLLLTLSSRRPKAVEESEKQWIKYAKREDLKKYVAAVLPFRKYYGYTEKNAVTKCFLSSDKRFSLYDVCLFTAEDGTLRLAGDIRDGFLYMERDLGCYIFSREETAFSRVQKSEYAIEDGGRQSECVLLTAGDVWFLLGIRAWKALKKFEAETEKILTSDIDKPEKSW